MNPGHLVRRAAFMWRYDPVVRRMMLLSLGLFVSSGLGVALGMWSWWFPITQLAAYVVGFALGLLAKPS